jgi:F-box/TPR repeat protein Pof3
LQQLHDKTTRKLSPAQSVDPLTVLPVELAEIILEYLAFRQLVNCMRVSRGWRDYVSKLPRLWMHLDLSGARRPVPRKFIDKAVRRSKNRLTRVTIHRFEHFDVLKNVAKACRSLTDLEFISLPHAMSSTLIDIVQCATSLEKFVVHPQISSDTVTQILNARPTLKHVHFPTIRASRHLAQYRGPFPHLEHISMQYEPFIGPTSSSLPSLLALTPNVQHLNISNPCLENAAFAPMFTFLPLTTLILKVGRNPFPTQLPPTLQRLSIEYTGSYQLRASDAPALLRSSLPALTHLTLVNLDGMHPDRLEELLDMCTDADGQVRTLDDATPLQSLTIHGLPHDSGRPGLFRYPTTSLFARSPRILTPTLEHLDIAKAPCDDDEIEALLQHKTGLKSIDISHTSISGASIKMLVDKLPSLQTIRADNCPHISGRDAIEYARRKGVSVSCSMGEGKGGKKIRYS